MTPSRPTPTSPPARQHDLRPPQGASTGSLVPVSKPYASTADTQSPIIYFRPTPPTKPARNVLCHFRALAFVSPTRKRGLFRVLAFVSPTRKRGLFRVLASRAKDFGNEGRRPSSSQHA